jgi:phosphoribosylpyrophosphate synthetase
MSLDFFRRKRQHLGDRKMAKPKGDIVILSGNSHPDLSQKIADRLNVRLGACSLYHTTNRESVVDIGESVRGRDVFLVQTGSIVDRNY